MLELNTVLLLLPRHVCPANAIVGVLELDTVLLLLPPHACPANTIVGFRLFCRARTALNAITALLDMLPLDGARLPP